MNLLELKAAHGQEAWERLAEALDTSVAYISQLAHGHRRPSPALARRMVAEQELLTLVGLRPDIFGPAPEKQFSDHSGGEDPAPPAVAMPDPCQGTVRA